MKPGISKKGVALSACFARPVAVVLCAVSVVSCILNEERQSSTSDTDTDESTAIQVIDPCRVANELEYSPIEDFELGVGTQWWVSYDNTKETYREIGPEDCDDIQKISKDTCFVEQRPEEVCEETTALEDYCFVEQWSGREPSATEMQEGRCGISRYALRIAAEGLQIYGGAIGINFYMNPFDASEWDGISLWARMGKNSGQSLFFSVSDKYTDEVNGKLLFEDEEPYCLEVTDDERFKCDRFGAGIGLATDWRFFKIPFSALKQRGYGQTAPELDVKGILGVNVGFESGNWDFWIDDVAFYREKR